MDQVALQREFEAFVTRTPIVRVHLQHAGPPNWIDDAPYFGKDANGRYWGLMMLALYDFWVATTEQGGA